MVLRHSPVITHDTVCRLPALIDTNLTGFSAIDTETEFMRFGEFI
jgi:hypothetical protein